MFESKHNENEYNKIQLFQKLSEYNSNFDEKERNRIELQFNTIRWVKDGQEPTSFDDQLETMPKSTFEAPDMDSSQKESSPSERKHSEKKTKRKFWNFNSPLDPLDVAKNYESRPTTIRPQFSYSNFQKTKTKSTSW